MKTAKGFNQRASKQPRLQHVEAPLEHHIFPDGPDLQVKHQTFADRVWIHPFYGNSNGEHADGLCLLIYI